VPIDWAFACGAQIKAQNETFHAAEQQWPVVEAARDRYDPIE
jgi:hypothetical protein